VAFPTYVNKGAFAHQATGSSLSVGLPSGWAADDIFIITLLHANPGSAVPSGWTRVATEQDFGARSLSVFAKRATSSEGSVSCTLTGGGSLGNSCAQMEAYRGCSTSGAGWEASAASLDTTVEVAFSSTTLTTLGADRLVHVSAGQAGDVGGQRWSNWGGTNLANITERVDDGFTDGTGGSIATAHGEKATAGSAGPFTADKDGSRADANVIMALVPPTGPVEVTSSDSVTISDAVERILSLFRSTSNSISITDAVTRVLSLSREVADSLSITDAVVALKIIARTVEDSLSITDSVTRISTSIRDVADSLSIADSVERLLTNLRTTSDSIGISDVVSATKIIIRDASDSISISDSVSRTISSLRTAADSLSITDAVGRIVGLNRTASDSVAISDAATINIVSGAGGEQIQIIIVM